MSSTRLKPGLVRVRPRLDGYVMTLMSDKRTNLPGKIFIYISPRAGAKHEPRIRVSKIRGRFASDYLDTFTVSIEAFPKVAEGTSDFKPNEMKAIFKWVKRNRINLTIFWNSDTMSSSDITALLEPLRRPGGPLRRSSGRLKVNLETS